MTLPAGYKPGSSSRDYDNKIQSENTPDQPAVDEQIIWQNLITKGTFHKEVVETQTLTNFRVKKNSYQIYLHELDDVLVMNRHSVRSGTYVSTGRYVRAGYGNSNNKSIGDVVFIYQGKPAITFYQLGDPAGLVRLAKAARKSAPNP